MNNKFNQQGSEQFQGMKSKAMHRWVLGSSVFVACVMAISFVSEYSDFHDMARNYHHTMQENTDQRLHVMSLVTARQEK